MPFRIVWTTTSSTPSPIGPMLIKRSSPYSSRRSGTVSTSPGLEKISLASSKLIPCFFRLILSFFSFGSKRSVNLPPGCCVTTIVVYRGAVSIYLCRDRDLLLRIEAACRLSELAPAPSITLLVEPEGGFAAEDASTALRAGYRALRLGPRVLRRDRGGRGLERPAGAAGRSRLGASRTAAASILLLKQARASPAGLLPETQRRFR